MLLPALTALVISGRRRVGLARLATCRSLHPDHDQEENQSDRRDDAILTSGAPSGMTSPRGPVNRLRLHQLRELSHPRSSLSRQAQLEGAGFHRGALTHTSPAQAITSAIPALSTRTGWTSTPRGEILEPATGIGDSTVRWEKAPQSPEEPVRQPGETKMIPLKDEEPGKTEAQL